MKFIYLKINQIKDLPKGSYTAWIGTSPIGISKSGELDRNTKSTRMWPMETKQPETTSISIVIKHHKFLSGESEAARAMIPVKWFPSNSVVTDWFPLVSPTSFQLEKNAKPLISLTVHVSDHRAKEFSAPPGALLVAPAWDRPGMPARPPVMPSAAPYGGSPGMYPPAPGMAPPPPGMAPQSAPGMYPPPAPGMYPPPPQNMYQNPPPTVQPNIPSNGQLYPQVDNGPSSVPPPFGGYPQMPGSGPSNMYGAPPIPVISDTPGFQAPPYIPPPSPYGNPNTPPGSAGNQQAPPTVPIYAPPPNPYADIPVQDPVYTPGQPATVIPQYPQIPPA
ncbi:hypothetical protein TRFO_39020 [Tritrichomonas foetus]|uniref:Uncharacterized protein n=1 Tax=Tritrichomonas foetus TaxID=1144522 RepID=A0A1J4JC21_9EUKA|nr:hypothetical protein TRFO_39020 [Tritrichomonas foetus]|eukprot:OHS94804.1 hypothetical protein TRFO_39020 [Tritrichomonas foetus]